MRSLSSSQLPEGRHHPLADTRVSENLLQHQRLVVKPVVAIEPAELPPRSVIAWRHHYPPVAPDPAPGVIVATIGDAEKSFRLLKGVIPNG